MKRRGIAGAPLLTFLLAASALALGSAASAAPREYIVFHADHAPAVDGDLRDEIWRATPWSGHFTGLQGQKADVDTQFAMAWDEKFLYVAVRCAEPQMEAVQTGVAGRDSRIVNDDHIEILLASADKPTVFYQIFINSGQGRLDQRIEEGTEKDDTRLEKRRSLLEKGGLETAARAADKAEGRDSAEWTIEAAIPLPKVKLGLKEGVTLVGNVRRVRPAGNVREMVWNARAEAGDGDVRQSADLGLFKLAGPAGAGARTPAQGGDTVFMRNGDVLKGSVIRMTNGKIEFASPVFAENVSVSAAEAARMELAWTESDASPTRLIGSATAPLSLAGGMEISGKIASLTADKIVIESPAFGRLSVPRALLARISCGASSVESRFDAGLLKPWESVAGTCSVADGALRLGDSGRSGQFVSVLSLPMHQDRTVTLAADYESNALSPSIRIILFADRAHPQMQVQSGVQLILGPMAVLSVTKDGVNLAPPLPRQRVPQGRGPAQVKLIYNPSDGVATAWLNGAQVAAATAPDGPRQGEFVLFGAMKQMTVKRLSVYYGFPAPDERAAAPKEGEVTAYLSNGDSVRARDISFEDGSFVLATEFGPMKLSLDRIVAIDFPPQAQKAAGLPLSVGGWVETTGCRFPLEVQAITGDAVIGKNKEFGAVKLRRQTVKSIQFKAAD